MAGILHIDEKLPGEKGVLKAVLGGSLSEGIVSGLAFILALVGLAGLLPESVLPIAVIAMGVAFLAEGIAISMRYEKLLAETSRDRLERAEFGVGLSSEFLGGTVGIVLGVLALLGINVAVTVPAAVIVYGATLMLRSGVAFRLNEIELEGSEESTQLKRAAREMLSAAASTELLLGISAVALGIVALTGMYPGTISLVGMLVVGFTGLVTGSAVTVRMLSLFRR